MIKKVGFMLLVLVLFACSDIAVAQPPTCGFYGNADIEGQSVPDGTWVKAWIDGKEVESVKTQQYTEGNSSYNYKIKIDDQGGFDGKTIVFTVGSLDLQAGTAEWTSGENSRLNLNGLESESHQSLPQNPSITLTPTEGLVTRIEGEGYNPGSDLTVTIDGTKAGETRVGLDSTFAIVVAAPLQVAGTYNVVVADAGGRSDQGIFIVPDLQGATGIDGMPGVDGMVGAKGDSGGTTLAVVALILSGIAIAASVILVIRFADFTKKNKM